MEVDGIDLGWGILELFEPLGSAVTMLVSWKSFIK